MSFSLRSDSTLTNRARRIRLLALDVDGVLTDGRLYFQADGIESKAFHTQDGLGIKLLQRTGVDVALITGRDSPMVSQRAAALGIAHVHQDRDDKLAALQELCRQLNLTTDQAAYAGDDLPDLAAIKQAGLGMTVPNAPMYIQEHADWVTEHPGGQAAVRDICDMLLKAQDNWQAILDSYLSDS
ncbi:KdsC family phosphatase [Aidingimonas halophila]|uniref:3-deoxy-D-manno-octulosonate 8-phosphate phosphatase KdsC n=1 Tax=Aidingimonas halophila TaxID=574349 RepID=A0A1H2QY92_9GAMM|nr:HAD hydrolase family protein [Aidingimonas halophila]GHC20099.1 hypothetical protein GCM10008094_07860 [Aidingimonas halophila]SDW12075.1 3-deoxy-D-manno-octulosonate 8-phosphate phosphatase (KDO 8-P phosphatase) [Aidingimonas halophila]